MQNTTIYLNYTKSTVLKTPFRDFTWLYGFRCRRCRTSGGGSRRRRRCRCRTSGGGGSRRRRCRTRDGCDSSGGSSRRRSCGGSCRARSGFGKRWCQNNIFEKKGKKHDTDGSGDDNREPSMFVAGFSTTPICLLLRINKILVHRMMGSNKV